MKFRATGMAEKQLDENDYRQLILEAYTFAGMASPAVSGKARG